MSSKIVLRDVGIYINGVEQSNYVHALKVEAEREEIDITGLGAFPSRELYPGQESLTFSFSQFAGNSTVDTMLRQAYRDGSSVFVQVAPHSTAASPTNPTWEADCIVLDYQSFKSDVGEATTAEITLTADGIYDILASAPAGGIVVGSTVVALDGTV